MNKEQIIEMFESGSPLVWNDPDPIDGNDYTIRSISYIDDEMATIQYGDNLYAVTTPATCFLDDEMATIQYRDNSIMFDNKPCFSEAEVFISEISLN